VASILYEDITSWTVATMEEYKLAISGRFGKQPFDEALAELILLR